mmetsp:Transcript_30780/g.68208  ORF Transcript_30780/g.68208 Transcript_30780/m.68208 type:complete len:143 (-) Transcript_30780:1781-2209(-)
MDHRQMRAAAQQAFVHVEDFGCFSLLITWIIFDAPDPHSHNTSNATLPCNYIYGILWQTALHYAKGFPFAAGLAWEGGMACRMSLAKLVNAPKSSCDARANAACGAGCACTNPPNCVGDPIGAPIMGAAGPPNPAICKPAKA